MSIDIERLKVDADYWSLCGAPEDATHYSPKEVGFDPCWMKFDGQWRAKYTGSTSGNWGFDDPDDDPRRYIPRPIKQEWDGGLPPVGTVCEKSPHWHKCEIIAEHDGGLVIYDMHTLSYYKVGKGMNFRPLKSPHERQREELSALCDDYIKRDDYGHSLAGAILSHYNLEPKP